MDKPLQPGQITSKNYIRPRSYDIELDSASKIERNRRHIIPCTSENFENKIVESKLDCNLNSNSANSANNLCKREDC